MDRRDVAQRRMIGLSQPNRVAVEGENREALVRVAANPDGIALHPGRPGAQTQAFRLGTFADDGDIRRQVEQPVDLALERHVAVPGDDPHGVAAYPPNGQKQMPARGYGA
jgi:hypothetical protein